jgi:hypothetical protein
MSGLVHAAWQVPLVNCPALRHHVADLTVFDFIHQSWCVDKVAFGDFAEAFDVIKY